MNFIEKFYHNCTAYGFMPLGEESQAISLAETGGFTLAREEGSALCLLSVIDLKKINSEICIYLRDRDLERAVALNSMYSSVMVVFLWVGSSPPAVHPDSYFGQSPYAVYWNVDPETKNIYVCEGQPDNVMGIRDLVHASLEDISEDTPIASSTPESDPAVHHSNNERVGIAPVFTVLLMAANIIIMLMMYASGYADMPLYVAARFGAIVPSLIWGAGEYYRLITAMFVHFGWAHLFFNVAGLLIFGTRVEKYYGKAAFLAIYIFSGFMASVASLLLTRGFSAGASGAVYGLIGAAFIYTRYLKKSMDVINSQVILVYIVMGMGMSFVMPGIDYFGHIGGLLAGIIIGYVMLKVVNNE